MTERRLRRPRDPLQLGKLIVDIATGQVEDHEDDGKDPNAAVLGTPRRHAGRPSHPDPHGFLGTRRRSAFSKAKRSSVLPISTSKPW